MNRTRPDGDSSPARDLTPETRRAHGSGAAPPSATLDSLPVPPLSARALNLYAPACVCRRPWSGAVDAHAPRSVALPLRRLSEDVLRTVLPDAAGWRVIAGPEGDRGRLADLARMGPGWGDATLAAVAAVADGDAGGAGDGALQLSILAEAAGFPLMAAVLAEVAALGARGDATRALRVATLARDRADHRAAAWWGRRAAYLSTRQRDWTGAVRGWARAADGLNGVGLFRRAAAARQREVAAARRAGERDLYARALHSAMAAHYAAGDVAAARRAAPEVIRAYPLNHPNLPALAVDLAILELENDGARRALSILRAAEPLLVTFDARMVWGVYFAEAGALSANGEAYKEGAGAALAAMEAARFGGRAAWALGRLAGTAWRMMGDAAKAREWAEQARGLARQRRERAFYRTARTLLAELPPLAGERA